MQVKVSNLPSGLGQGPGNEIVSFVQKQADELRSTTLTTLLTQGAVALALILVASAAIAWLISGRLLQPLHQMTEAASRIANADSAGRGLHERIALDGPHDEVRRLADAFDLMLARLDRSFDGQRRFVANASHELRTPLALNRALVELAITRDGVSPDAQRLGESLLKVNERHERLIEGLLMLADSETELTAREPVDLADVVRHVILSTPAGLLAHATVGARPRHDSGQPVSVEPTRGNGSGRDVRSPGEIDIRAVIAPATITGDPVLLERLVQNLVENAIRYNVSEGGWLRVETSAAKGQARLVVSNTGPVVPAYEMETIFQPFRRLGRERIGGAQRGFGLGLSIVRAITRAHGGNVQATPRPGGGLTVTVTL
jgi:signal transduction histidine kinase